MTFAELFNEAQNILHEDNPVSDWQASDGQNTHSFSNDEFAAALNKLREKQRELHGQQAKTHQEYLNLLNNMLGGRPGATYNPKASQAAGKRWPSVEAMMADLAKQKAAAAPKPVDRAARKAEIEAELDIIRGRVPTPKGYTVDPLRAKKLMQELKQLT